jgi:AAA domain (dynein-related subfamily)
VTDASGRLVFQEGALLTALRRGQWLVLDELNLAPSEVLEALNRWACASSGLNVTCCMVAPYLRQKLYTLGGRSS